MSGWNMSDRCKMDRQRAKGFGNGQDRMNHNIVPTCKRKSSFLPGEWKLLVPWKYAFLFKNPLDLVKSILADNLVTAFRLKGL